MKDKNKNSLFICQLTENSLKVIKCLLRNKSKVEFVGLEIESIPTDIDVQKLSEKLNQVFKKLQYCSNPVIISLPRNLATCRYLKIPASTPEEIANIAYLQAPRYLPYPADELITAFQKISTDKEGYAHINLIIVHKATIERQLKIFKELKSPKISVVLSSYGLASLYSYIKPDEQGPVMVIELDEQQAELAIISSMKLLFSRSFKLDRTNPDWVNLLVEQINRTQEAFLKEIAQEAQLRIVLVGSGKALQELPENLNKQTGLPIEVLSYIQQIHLSDNLFNAILNLEHSCASLFGLGLGETEDSLNLLPREVKKEVKNITQRKRALNMALLTSVAILLLGLGIAKDLDNKSRYLVRLRAELNKIAQEAKPLEDIEKRFVLLEKQLGKKQAGLELLYELHRIIPSSVSLVALNVEEDKLVSLRGQTIELNSVFAFVDKLEKSPVFKGFNVKVRYATGKKTQAGEIVDFEIGCLKK